MSELTDALEAWRAAKRDLEAVTPWTAPWLRARMVEEELRLAYLAIADESEGDVPADAEERAHRPASTRPGRI